MGCIYTITTAFTGHAVWFFEIHFTLQLCHLPSLHIRESTPSSCHHRQTFPPFTHCTSNAVVGARQTILRSLCLERLRRWSHHEAEDQQTLAHGNEPYNNRLSGLWNLPRPWAYYPADRVRRGEPTTLPAYIYRWIRIVWMLTLSPSSQSRKPGYDIGLIELCNASNVLLAPCTKALGSRLPPARLCPRRYRLLHRVLLEGTTVSSEAHPPQGHVSSFSNPDATNTYRWSPVSAPCRTILWHLQLMSLESHSHQHDQPSALLDTPTFLETDTGRVGLVPWRILKSTSFACLDPVSWRGGSCEPSSCGQRAETSVSVTQGLRLLEENRPRGHHDLLYGALRFMLKFKDSVDRVSLNVLLTLALEPGKGM
jgi:hypothetical protein